MKRIHIIRLVFLSMRHHLNLVMRKYEAKPKQDCAKLIQSCPTLCDYMDCRLPGSLSMGFFRQEYWSGLPCPPPGDLPNPGIKPCLLHLLHWQMGSLPLGPPRKLTKQISIAKGDFVNRPIFKIKSGSIQQSPLNFYKVTNVNLQILKLIGQNNTEEPFLTEGVCKDLITKKHDSQLYPFV